MKTKNDEVWKVLKAAAKDKIAGPSGVMVLAYLALCRPNDEVPADELQEEAGVSFRNPNRKLMRMQAAGYVRVRPEVAIGAPGRLMVSLAKQED